MLVPSNDSIVTVVQYTASDLTMITLEAAQMLGAIEVTSTTLDLSTAAGRLKLTGRVFRLNLAGFDIAAFENVDLLIGCDNFRIMLPLEVVILDDRIIAPMLFNGEQHDLLCNKPVARRRL